MSTDGAPAPKTADSAQNAVDESNPDEDDLDALLAESGAPDMPSMERSQAVPVPEDDPFADDMEALAEMEDLW
jgi:replication fork protection complex subunit Csm3/Swi3